MVWSSEEIYEEYLWEVGEYSKRLRNRVGLGVFLEGIVGVRGENIGGYYVAIIEGAEQAGDRDKHKAVDTGGVSEGPGGGDSDEEGGEGEEG